jgi:DNA-binding HxlR family transcriptional regulator
MKKMKLRSECPISSSLDLIGDKWTLLILRDMIFVEKSSYGEFMKSEEGIASNILADRLSLLESADIISKEISTENKSKFIYKITKKGISLLPVIIELYLWGADNFPKKESSELLDKLRNHKNKTLKEYERRLLRAQ